MDQPIELANSDNHHGNTSGHIINEHQIQACIYQFIDNTNMVISHFSHVPFDVAYHISNILHVTVRVPTMGL